MLVVQGFAPPDPDGDGVAGGLDNCPDVPNADQTNTDGDAFGDACDTDDDNDGLSDTAEAAAGTDPLDPDTDNDGIPDGADQCPAEPGPATNNGCPDVPPPVDTDGDGVPDSQDLCPTVPGPANNNGCPVTDEVVGGEILGIDMTSMFVAGAFANATWIIPIAGVTAGIIGFVIRKRIKSHKR